MLRPMSLDLRNLKLDAELNEEYYRVCAARAAFWDRLVQVLAAIAGLSAVTSWMAAGPAYHLWAVLSVVSAILSAVNPAVRWFDDAVKFSGLAARWTDLAGRLRVLTLAALPEEQLRPKLVDLREAMEALQREDTSEPRRRLIAKIQTRIEQRHGLVWA